MRKKAGRNKNLGNLAISVLNQKKSAPTGIRTPVYAVRGRRPRPLDDGSKDKFSGHRHRPAPAGRFREEGENRGFPAIRGGKRFPLISERRSRPLDDGSNSFGTIAIVINKRLGKGIEFLRLGLDLAQRNIARMALDLLPHFLFHITIAQIPIDSLLQGQADLRLRHA